MRHTRFDDSSQISMSWDKANFGGVYAHIFPSQGRPMKLLSVSKLNANHVYDVLVLSLQT